MSRRHAILLFALALGCANPPLEVDVEGRSEAIYGGSVTTMYPEVVAVARLGRVGSGGLCTGTAISPFAVVTAKHCVYESDVDGGVSCSPYRNWSAVPRSEFIVSQTNDINATIDPYLVAYDVLTVVGGTVCSFNEEMARGVPGNRVCPTDVDTDMCNGDDIAIILLPGPLSGVTPRTVATRLPRNDEAVTIVGYGENDRASIETGTKFVGNARATDIRSFGRFDTYGTAGICQGDSGGPVIDSDGRLSGISSYGPPCQYRQGTYTALAFHGDIVSRALAHEVACVEEPERCGDRLDNDCDDGIDEGCTALGEPCSTDAECASECIDTGAGRVCTRECDPRDAIPRCPFGFYCESTGCALGRCVAGNPGSKADGEVCTNDLECASNNCTMTAGAMRCGRQCSVGLDPCPDGDLCEITSGDCGACIPVELSTGPRPFGSPCDTNGQCESGNCREGDFCTDSCDRSSPCGNGFHCRAGECVRGGLGQNGDPCITEEDCSASSPECVEVDGANLCVAPCDDTCTGAFSCSPTSVGDRCTPEGLPLGVACEANAQCRSGICAGTCTIVCDDIPCPEGFDCIPAGAVSGCFPASAPPDPPGGRGGCAAAPAVGGGAAGAFGLLAIALLGYRRRR